MAKKSINEIEYSDVLKYFSVESKAKIMTHFYSCKSGECININQLCEKTGLKQSNVSKHIMDLKATGFLTPRKTGREVFYSINPKFKKDWGTLVDAIIASSKTLQSMQCPCGKA